MRKKVIIMGAGGRDFHNFNVYFKNNCDYEVVAFTATQIPHIENRIYPKELAGELYPNGIPIYSEEKLEELIKKHNIDLVVFSYSDVHHLHVMHTASRVLSCGADYLLLGTRSTMLTSSKPVVAVCAVRTGCGKSPTSRYVAKILRSMGKKVVIVRHPMPYSKNLLEKRVERFENFSDLDNCTIEEREEYEPFIANGFIVYSGVDYKEILCRAEKESDVIVWDGGNNDFPFFTPSILIVVVDPLRTGHETLYHPGETCLRFANIIVINKIDSVKKDRVKKLISNITEVNQSAKIIKTQSKIFVDKPELIKAKSVVVVEDGPTITHGEMEYGAGYISAKKYGAKEIIDPHPYAIGDIKSIYEKYKHIGRVIPALGYSKNELEELSTILNNIPAETIILATPSHIDKVVNLNKPCVKVWYEIEEIDGNLLADYLCSLL